MKKHRPHGFSLLELMVVIVLLAVLALVAIPLQRRVGEQSKSIKCLTNIRSIGTILLNAAKDRNERFSAWYTGSDGMMWNTMLIIEGYSTHEILKRTSCPSIEYAAPNGSISGRHYGICMTDPYGKIEGLANSSGKVIALVYSLDIRTHPAPASSPFLADSVTSTGTPSIRIFPAGANFAGGGIHTRHNDQANLFFLDGHAESASHARLSQLGVQSVYTKSLQVLSLTPP